jgi:hypothetical protein
MSERAFEQFGDHADDVDGHVAKINAGDGNSDSGSNAKRTYCIPSYHEVRGYLLPGLADCPGE